MKPGLKLAGQEPTAGQQKLVAELFHALSQPITALRCSLELALYTQSRPSKENLEMALAHAEKIAQLASGIRELVQADDPGDARAALVLKDCLRGIVVDMEAMAEAAQVAIDMSALGPARVMAEPKRLHQALFYLLEFALSSAVPGAVLRITSETQADQEMTMLSLSERKLALPSDAALEKEAKSEALSRRLGLAIAARIFESAGGRLQMLEDDHAVRLRFYLPLAQ